VLRGHCFVGLFIKEYAYLSLFSGAPYPYPIHTLSEGLIYPPSEGGGEGEGKGIILNNKENDFEKFWKAYPNKTSKKAALLEWNKNRDKPDIEFILKSIENQKKYKENLKLTKKFCPEWPDPERWIKKERWNDEVPKMETAQESPQSSPYVICEKCGAETYKENFIEEGGQKYCPKCPRIAERGKAEAKKQYEKIGNLIKTVGKDMPAAH
jgi:hypothetical protein